MTRPPTFKPMMATSTKAPAKRAGFVYEPKLDGVRSIVETHEGKTRIWSRNGSDVTECYPEITRLPSSIMGVSAVWDGEIVAIAENGLPNFQLLQQRMNRRSPSAAQIAAVPVAMFVFDVLWLDGENLTNLALLDRRRRLEQFQFDRSWQLTPRLDIELTEHVIDSFLGAGLEGVIVKSEASTYRPGERTTSWVKVKARHHARAVICGYLIEKARVQIGSLALGMYDSNGDLRYVGQIANSLPHAQAEQLDRFLRSIQIADSPYADLVSDSLAYTQPHVVIEVAYTEVTAAGTFRQPILRSVLVEVAAREAVMSVEFETAVSARTAVKVGGGQRL